MDQARNDLHVGFVRDPVFEGNLLRGEVELLEQHGTQLQRLTNGVRAPTTEAQHRFVEVARGNADPETIYEQVWWKYLQRPAWEGTTICCLSQPRESGFQ